MTSLSPKIIEFLEELGFVYIEKSLTGPFHWEKEYAKKFFVRIEDSISTITIFYFDKPKAVGFSLEFSFNSEDYFQFLEESVLSINSNIESINSSMLDYLRKSGRAYNSYSFQQCKESYIFLNYISDPHTIELYPDFKIY